MDARGKAEGERAKGGKVRRRSKTQRGQKAARQTLLPLDQCAPLGLLSRDQVREGFRALRSRLEKGGSRG